MCKLLCPSLFSFLRGHTSMPRRSLSKNFFGANTTTRFPTATGGGSDAGGVGVAVELLDGPGWLASLLVLAAFEGTVSSSSGWYSASETRMLCETSMKEEIVLLKTDQEPRPINTRRSFPLVSSSFIRIFRVKDFSIWTLFFENIFKFGLVQNTHRNAASSGFCPDLLRSNFCRSFNVFLSRRFTFVALGVVGPFCQPEIDFGKLS